jgi:ketosteroid isomerase-like protein
MKFATQVPDAAWTIDRIAIQDVISSVSVHSDLKEPTEVYQYYTDDAVMDYTTLFGEEGGKLPVRVQRQRIMEFFPGFDATHHQTTNFQITIDGDEATSRAQVRATHRIDDDRWVVGGTYHHKLRRTPNGWKISYHRFDLAYIEGVDLVERARARVNARKVAQPA